MSTFTRWHRRQVNVWKQRLDWGEYTLLWVAYLKGLITGALIVWLFF